MTVDKKEYIERDEILRKISKMIDYCKKDYKVNALTALFQCGDAVIDCKSADVQEVKRGEWKEEIMPFDYDCVCSVCGKSGTPNYNYCPNCGAKMDGKDDT